MNAAISASNIYMKYKKSDKSYSLKNINFQVAKGEFHAFIGENGAGKSTTIRILTGLNSDFEGDLFINELNAVKESKARDKLCYIPDKAVFPTGISAYDFVYNLALLERTDKEKLRIELEEWIDKLHLREHMSKNPNKLSSGQAKKILLMRAALEKSTIIILDEPVAFLDPTSRLQFFELLKLLNQQGITIFMSSHILDEIKNYIDSVTFIKQGEIKWSGKIKGDELISKYKEVILDGQI
ncbi:MAG: ABC transporter ATP-binding protein [Mycoplasmataceae bacterium]|nr:ABC transporter ATP-binding protein [Mycoplasmataceae bacterium]